MVGKDCAAKAPVVPMKETVLPKQEAVIAISSDEKEICKSERKVKEGSSKNSTKTLTAILTARSKVYLLCNREFLILNRLTSILSDVDWFDDVLQDACGLKKKPKDLIVDIDAADVENELAAVEYIEDIYSFYKLAEVHLFTDCFRRYGAKICISSVP